MYVHTYVHTYLCVRTFVCIHTSLVSPCYSLPPLCCLGPRRRCGRWYSPSVRMWTSRFAPQWHTSCTRWQQHWGEEEGRSLYCRVTYLDSTSSAYAMYVCSKHLSNLCTACIKTDSCYSPKLNVSVIVQYISVFIRKWVNCIGVRVCTHVGVKVYSGTSLQCTPLGPSWLPCIERCP